MDPERRRSNTRHSCTNALIRFQLFTIPTTYDKRQPQRASALCREILSGPPHSQMEHRLQPVATAHSPAGGADVVQNAARRLQYIPTCPNRTAPASPVRPKREASLLAVVLLDPSGHVQSPRVREEERAGDVERVRVGGQRPGLQEGSVTDYSVSLRRYAGFLSQMSQHTLHNYSFKLLGIA